MTQQPKHTPAPWSISAYANNKIMAAIDWENICIATIEQKTGFADVKIPFEANARLISAAPELLANLEQCLVCLQVLDPENPAIGMAEQAIAKARGVTK